MRNFNFIKFLPLAIFALILSCNKNDGPEPDQEEEPTDLWEYTEQWLKDSTGNSYYLAATHDQRLQIRVKDSLGELVLSKDLTMIDSSEIPQKLDGYNNSASMFLTAPNPYISAKDASLSIRLFKINNTDDTSSLRLIANIDLETGNIYEKKYKPKDDEDLTYIENGYSVVQWYQNTILVREITKKELREGGFMGLDRSRGTRLVCYERDFTIRYIKNINVAAASYPSNRGKFIPVSNNEGISFLNNYGLIRRFSILVSQEDLWTGVKQDVWEVDLKQLKNLSQTDVVKITDFDIQGLSVFANYEVYDSLGNMIMKDDGEWDIRTGFPLKKFNP